jgi:hypothetical protein
MTTTTLNAYRQPMFSSEDGLFHRCLGWCAMLGAMFLIAVMLAPIREKVITRVEQLPPRFAKLILEPAKPKVPPHLEPRPVAEPGGTPGGEPAGGGGVTAPEPAAGPAPAPPPIALSPRGPASALAPGAGAAGRARAQQGDRRVGARDLGRARDVARRTVDVARRLERRGAPRSRVRRRSRDAIGAIGARRGSDRLGVGRSRQRRVGRSRRLGGHELDGRDRRSLAGWRRRRWW